MDEKLKSVELTAKPVSFQKLNDQLTKCRCYVLASGENANYSDITLDAIKDAMPSIYNMPVVAHLKQKKGEDGWYVGGHDIELKWNEDGLDVVDLTVPFGVVPENCNPEFEEVLEPDGISKNTYLTVDIYLWHGRYNILDAKYDDDIYFNQSVEILTDEIRWKDNGFLEIRKYHYSALCLLGKSDDPKYTTTPCFPSARVERPKFSIDEENFKKDFAELMKEVKTFSLSISNEIDNITQSPEEHSDEDNAEEFNKEEKELSKKKPDATKVFEALTAVLSEFKFKTAFQKEVSRYEYLMHNDSTITVVDRDEKYAIYEIPYFASEVEDKIVCNLDLDKKVEKSFVVGEKTESLFDLQGEIDRVADETAEYKVEQYSSNQIETLTTDLSAMTDKYNEAVAENTRLSEQLGVFQKEKDAYAAELHKNAVDVFIAASAEEMGKYSKFLEYCVDVDYTKELDAIKAEVKEIRYTYLESKAEKPEKFSRNFSVQHTDPATGVDAIIAARYGNRIASILAKTVKQ